LAGMLQHIPWETTMHKTTATCVCWQHLNQYIISPVVHIISPVLHQTTNTWTNISFPQFYIYKTTTVKAPAKSFISDWTTRQTSEQKRMHGLESRFRNCGSLQQVFRDAQSGDAIGTKNQ
jgi:hypothetical protein